MVFIESIFKYEFIQNAYLIGLLLGFVAPLIGACVVMKRLSLIVEGISHIAMAGISFSMFLNKLNFIVINPLLMGMFFSLVGSSLIDKISNSFKKYKEVSIPIVISLSTALMITFASLAGGFNQSFTSFMFGNILTTTRVELYIVLMLVITIIIVIKLKFNGIMAFTIDENYCKYMGINIKNYKIVFNILLAIMISISIKVVGMLLVSSLVIIPITSASKVSRSFKSTLIYGIIFSEISVIGGLICSYYLNIPSGATIVFINLAIFFGCILFSKKKIII